jgi:hypothetical protein
MPPSDGIGTTLQIASWRFGRPDKNERARDAGKAVRTPTGFRLHAELNPDAHSVRELDARGVKTARKGGVPADRALNATSPLESSHP